jgi:hypothetical protein
LEKGVGLGMRLASLKGLTRIIANTFPWQEMGLYFGHPSFAWLHFFLRNL